MTQQQAALLIGKITHARKDWDALAKVVQLKVQSINTTSIVRLELTRIQEYGSGTRQEFLQNCKAGKYDGVVAIFRSNASTTV